MEIICNDRERKGKLEEMKEKRGEERRKLDNMREELLKKSKGDEGKRRTREKRGNGEVRILKAMRKKRKI